MTTVILSGRLTANPDVRNVQGQDIATYTLAVDRRSKEQKADFFRCVCWEKKAEFAEKYLQKGTKILVTGHLQTGSYTDKDGKKVYTTDVIVDNHEFCEAKQAAKQDEGFISADDLETPFS